MALIKCSECGKEISDKAEKCIHCGYPIKNESIVNPIKNESIVKKKAAQGKVVFQTSNDFIGLLGKYTIKDKDGNIVAKLKANDYFETSVDTDTTFYIRYSGAFTTFKEAFAPANCVSRFSIGLSGGGASFYVTKI